MIRASFSRDGGNELVPQPLTAGDLRHVSLDFRHQLSRRDAEHLLEHHPGRSVWLPETREFALASPWRRRADIACVLGLEAPAHPVELLQAVSAQCEMQGDRLVVLVESNERRNAALYARAGFPLIEEVISMEMPLTSGQSVESPWQIRAVDAANEAEFEQLLAVDHAAFPWIWQNSVAELRTYLATERIVVLVATVDSHVVGYIGMTLLANWAHIDRLAVSPAMQGRGIGKAMLAAGMAYLEKVGIRIVGLSTQKDNEISQRLYQQMGFRRNPDEDYRIYGKYLNQ